MAADPSQFARRTRLTSTGLEFALGFEATVLRLANRSGVPIFFRLSSGAASSGDPILEPGDIERFTAMPPFSGVALGTTSSATSTDPGIVVDVAAWSGGHFV